MLKKLFLSVTLLAVLALIAAAYLFSNIDSLVKSAVVKYGSAATGTNVQLESVDLSLSKGLGTLKGLSIGNPTNFSADQALSLGSITVKIDTSSLQGKTPLVLDEVSIKKPQIHFEVNATGKNNLDVISQNAEQYASQSAGQNSSQTASPANSKDGSERKFIIKSLTIDDGEVFVHQPASKDPPLKVTLPSIHILNIGKNTDGATASDIANRVLSVLSSESLRAVQGSTLQQVGDTLKKATQQLLNGASNGFNNLKGQIGTMMGH